MITCRRLLCTVLATAVTLTAVAPALADPPHEDPDKAQLVFDGASLFRYLTASLDLLLGMDPAGVTQHLEGTAHANIHERARNDALEAADLITKMAPAVVAIDTGVSELHTLMSRSQVPEIAPLIARLARDLASTESQLDATETAVVLIGQWYEVQRAVPDSGLRLAYEELLARLQMLRDLLDMYRRMLEDTLAVLLPAAVITPGQSGAPDEQAGEPDTTSAPDGSGLPPLPKDPATWLRELGQGTVALPELTRLALERLRFTSITAAVTPESAFVGETVTVSGRLTSSDGPLAGREVEIRLQGATPVTATTGAQGEFSVTVTAPYHYTAESRVRAFFFPTGADVGVYLSSVSEDVKLQVQFYATRLVLTVPDEAYPGLNAAITGRVTYLPDAPPVERKVEIRLDGRLVAEVLADRDFSLDLLLDPLIPVGEHILAASIPGLGRYSPAQASAVLNVTKVKPTLVMRVPGLLFMPGTLQLDGTLTSPLGRVKGAQVNFRRSTASASTTSGDGGSLHTALRLGWTAILLDSAPLSVTITPREPWYDTVSLSWSALGINYVNIGLFILLLVVMAIVPGRLRTRPRPAVPTAAATAGPVLPPDVKPETACTDVIPGELLQAAEAARPPDPRSRIFRLYVELLRLLQRALKVMLRPDQTLREFTEGLQARLGAAGRHLTDFTRTIEKLLYSRYEPTAEDTKASEELSHRIQGGLRE